MFAESEKSDLFLAFVVVYKVADKISSILLNVTFPHFLEKAKFFPQIFFFFGPMGNTENVS